MKTAPGFFVEEVDSAESSKCSQSIYPLCSLFPNLQKNEAGVYNFFLIVATKFYLSMILKTEI